MRAADALHETRSRPSFDDDDNDATMHDAHVFCFIVRELNANANANNAPQNRKRT